jgi:hypothetical protein
MEKVGGIDVVQAASFKRAERWHTMWLTLLIKHADMMLCLVIGVCWWCQWSRIKTRSRHPPPRDTAALARTRFFLNQPQTLDGAATNASYCRYSTCRLSNVEAMSGVPLLLLGFFLQRLFSAYLNDTPETMTTSRECVVCAELKDPAAFPGRPLTDRCNHTPKTCTECVKRCIQTHIAAESSTEISCPECAGILPFESIQRYADANSRQRYEELCMHRAMEEDKDFIWVLMIPTPCPQISLLTMRRIPFSVLLVVAAGRSMMAVSRTPLSSVPHVAARPASCARCLGMPT